ncbi:hypothetical protein MC7420_5479 [Coleofasciculus chthonoplastes PCC 7420]|uniref:Uncharacterized protein n=1 Tax=Coleofasciculus chthonoplastes PCC 7420 TaxID=118168 RepID=B4VPV8_9CYAN|nr:AAA-like domain-containing protein [Coleofasciculus chthonoplastes]EDX76045.1 hypothetical protein MC7420_5479 [Coleofasciculus chthonoplastes PCC 7420]
MSDSNYYKIGGSLEYHHPTYVVRQADAQLYQGLINGEFCYVLNSRQMGKSSLRVQMTKKLKAQGVKCAAIDMTRIGSHVTPEEWYGGLVSELLRGFRLSRKINFSNWWRDRSLLSPVQRLSEFIDDVLLIELSDNIVIFIDEIDSILKINFKDDFFTFIRACYNQRVDNPDYQRLTFCLLGVATPSDLIADKQRTPFNIGQAIELTGFTFAEANSALIKGLQNYVENAEAVLTEVLDWTGGQPFLTQKLCSFIVQEWDTRGQEFHPDNPSAANEIELLVQQCIIENWEAWDEPEHLRTIRDRILANEHRAGRLLGLYQHILQQGQIPTDESPEQVELRLTGLVVRQQRYLRVYNPIYAGIFNHRWVEKELANLRPYSQGITAWEESNCQDQSRLLQGQALQEALAWATNKSLSDRDYHFLAASQELDKRMALELERKQKEAVEQANQILVEATHKAQRTIRMGLGILFVSLFGAGVAGIVVNLVIGELKQTMESTRLERVSFQALQRFESRGDEIEGLLLAMEAGQALQKQAQDSRLLPEELTTSPVVALQQILDNIRERNQIKGHQQRIWHVSFSPNSKYMATASSDGTARLWDLSGNQKAEFKGHQGWVTHVSFSPNGEYIATAGEDGTARLWDLSGKQLVEFRGHQGQVWSVSFSPNGEYIATAGEDGTARLWDLSGQQLVEFRGHQGQVWSVSFSPNGEYIATAGEDGTARLWDLSGQQLVEFEGHQGKVLSVSFSPNSEYLATASTDGTARLWNLFGKQLVEFQGGVQGTVLSVDFSPNGEYIATAHDDSTTRLWDLSGNQIAELKGHQGWVTSVSFSPNGEYLATASEGGIVRLWDLFSHPKAEFRGHQGWLTSVSFSPNGQYIATASSDGTARLWDLSGNQNAEFKGHQGWVTRISFSPNGEYIATAGEDGTARLWDLSGNQKAEFKGHQDWLTDVSFSPNGQYMATASSDGTARLWDLSGKQKAEFKGHQGWVTSVSFSPNEPYIATAGEDGTVRFWHLSGNPLTGFQGHQDWITNVSFSPTGEYIATASHDGTARLWDLSGNPLAEFKGHQGWVRSVSFSPNELYIATAGEDGTARLWDLWGNPLAEFKGHQRAVTSVSFSPDGKYLATASHDGTARIWRVEELNEMLLRGCNWLNYYFVTHPQALEKLEVCQ